jgi:hypothetical protein
MFNYEDVDMIKQRWARLLKFYDATYFSSVPPTNFHVACEIK